jgi:high-affinity nickel-transport protein
MNPTALLGPQSPAWRVPWPLPRRHLTLFGRSVLLIGCELFANAACWVVAAVLFGGRNTTQPILSLALLAWVCEPLLCVRERTR